MVAVGEAPGVLLGGKYRLERVLGRGRSAVVWEATHELTGRIVAVKLFGDAVAAESRARERLRLEARVGSLVPHPNLLPIDDVLELEGGRAALVMERLEGESLRARLERAPLGLGELRILLVPALEALELAHAAGLVHRDLKPDNLFLAGERLMVLDFGIAKLRGDVGLDLTSTGVSMGTPFYMAPEQLFGDDDIDARADVWAIGVVIYEALTGTRPTEAANLGQLLKKVNARQLPKLDPACVGGDRALAALVDRMLDVDRARRPLLAEVRAVLAGEAPSPSPRAGRRLLGMAVLTTSTLVAAGLVVHFGGMSPRTGASNTEEPVPAMDPSFPVAVTVESAPLASTTPDAGVVAISSNPGHARPSPRAAAAVASSAPLPSASRTGAPPLYEQPPF